MMKKKGDAEQIEASHYETLQISVINHDQNDLSMSKIHDINKLSETSSKAKQLTKQQIDEILQENQILKQSLLVAQQNSQNYQKQLQKKNEQITYLSLKSLNLSKKMINNSYKLDKYEDEQILKNTQSLTMSIQQKIDSQQIEEKFKKLQNKCKKLKQKNLYLKNRLEKQQLEKEDLEHQLKMNKKKQTKNKA